MVWFFLMLKLDHSFRPFNVARSEKAFPEPVFLPYSFNHFIKGDSFGLREHRHYENGHDDEPGSEEEVNVGSHVAKHAEECLSYDECAKHVGGDRKEIA